MDRLRAEDDIRMKVEDAIMSRHDHISNSIFGNLVQVPSFEVVSGSVVLMNIIWIAIDTDYNHAAVLSEAPPACQLVSNLFCLFFVAEVSVRFLAFDTVRSARNDKWFVFDAVVVGLTVWETWIQVLLYTVFKSSGYGWAGSVSVFRILRLFRLAKLVRVGAIVRMFPEFMILVQAMGQLLRSAFVTAAFMVIVIFLYAIIFTQLLRDELAGAGGHFTSVVHAFNFLMLQVLCGPDADVAAEMLAVGGWYYFLYLSFTFFTTLALMNTLIGIICAAIVDASDDAKEAMICEQLMCEIQHMVDELDIDKSGSLDRDEFSQLINNKAIIKTLHKLGVDIVAFLDFSQFVYPETGLTMKDLVKLVFQFRSEKVATVKDLVEMRKYLSFRMADSRG